MSKLKIYKGFNFVTGIDYNDVFNPREMVLMPNTSGSISIEKKPEQKRLSLIRRICKSIQK